MDYTLLENYSFSELKSIAKAMDLPTNMSKKELTLSIIKAFQEYERYKNRQAKKYKKIKQLGNKGKEGITYLVEDKHKNLYAMKTFNKDKSVNKLKQEVALQKKASECGISPVVFDIDTVHKTITMEKMDCHLIDKIKTTRKLTIKQQKQIYHILTILDKINVFHADNNLLNFMYKNDKLYIIDFGFAKPIDKRLIQKLGTPSPNTTILLLGIIIKLKELQFTPSSYSFLEKQLQ